ncbi:MAG: hypothetical protein AAFN65_03550, partial [Bacteroidota bacterium]
FFLKPSNPADLMPNQYGTFDELLSITNESLQPIVRKLKAVIQQIDSEVHEVVRMGDRAATYGLGPRKMIEGYA